jgi:DNA/RNA-binding domain of Phe-tRNA-synthetase-like protein
MDPKVENLGVRGGYFLMEGLDNRRVAPELDAIRRDAVEQVKAGITKESLGADPVLEGFRELHRVVGRSSRQNVSSPENLLRLLLEGRHLPSINAVVDIYNIVSLQTRLALGAHDVAKITGGVSLRLTDGSEGFWPLGRSEPRGIGAGEYAYVDDDGDVLCRMEVRQVEKTKVTEETTACFYIVQGNATTSADYIREGVDRVVDLTRRFCGGQPTILHLP